MKKKLKLTLLDTSTDLELAEQDSIEHSQKSSRFVITHYKDDDKQPYGKRSNQGTNTYDNHIVEKEVQKISPCVYELTKREDVDIEETNISIMLTSSKAFSFPILMGMNCPFLIFLPSRFTVLLRMINSLSMI